MSAQDPHILQQEWVTLQQEYEGFEKYSLIIKLFNLALVAWTLAHDTMPVWIILVMGVVWLLDGIWKTFQSRTEARLLTVEKAIQEQQLYRGMQYHSAWQSHTQSAGAMIAEYVRQSLRPTVAVSHLACVAISGLAILT